jgi:hypothetical protein
MLNSRFFFLKTPQKKHRFISHVKNKNYPVIRLEIYRAISVGETYDFFGKSYSGIVAVDDFKTAIREGYVSLVVST